MPCYDGRDAADLYAQEAAGLRSMLCGICDRAEAHGMPGLITTDPALWAWWQQHQKTDNARKAHEAAQTKRYELMSAAAKKLTAEEWEALGIRI